MTELVRYIIRHTITGWCMPEPKGRARRGGSFSELVDPTDSHNIIRLFPTKKSAKASLVQWLRGVHVCKRTYDQYDGDVDEDVSIEPVSYRHPDDYVIEEVTMVLAQSFNRPVKTLYGAAFVGGMLYGYRSPDEVDNPHKAIRTSHVVKRHSRTMFETMSSSLYDVQFVPNGELTIPAEFK